MNNSKRHFVKLRFFVKRFYKIVDCFNELKNLFEIVVKNAEFSNIQTITNDEWTTINYDEFRKKKEFFKICNKKFVELQNSIIQFSEFTIFFQILQNDSKLIFINVDFDRCRI